MRAPNRMGAPGSRQMRAELEASLRETMEILQLEQECPNTFLKIAVRYDGESLVVRGWSKVNWPDTWSAAEGQRVAIRKALAKVSKGLMRKEQYYAQQQESLAAAGLGQEGQ